MKYLWLNRFISDFILDIITGTNSRSLISFLHILTFLYSYWIQFVERFQFATCRHSQRFIFLVFCQLIVLIIEQYIFLYWTELYTNFRFSILFWIGFSFSLSLIFLDSSRMGWIWIRIFTILLSFLLLLGFFCFLLFNHVEYPIWIVIYSKVISLTVSLLISSRNNVLNGIHSRLSSVTNMFYPPSNAFNQPPTPVLHRVKRTASSCYNDSTYDHVSKRSYVSTSITNDLR